MLGNIGTGEIILFFIIIICVLFVMLSKISKKQKIKVKHVKRKTNDQDTV
jgi:hypothetical protein